MKSLTAHLSAALVAVAAPPTVQRPLRVAAGPGRAAAHRRAWLRLLLLAMLWSSVQGLLGWWVVQATAQPGQAVVEVCTPNGMQWVALDGSTGFSEPGDPTAPQSPVAPTEWQSPCVWAAAGLSLPDFPLLAWGVLPAPVLGHAWVARRSADITPDTMARVLLMSPMRGPPLRWA